MKFIRRHKVLMIAVSVVLILIAGFLVYWKIYLPNYHYGNAVQFYENGDYENAISAFRALHGYKDSEQQIENCEEAIREAAAAAEQAKAEADAAAAEAQYREATELKNAGQYSEALAKFEALGDYKESGKFALECKNRIEAEELALLKGRYSEAQALYDIGNYGEAYEVFCALDYEDSAEKAGDCLFEMQIADIDPATFSGRTFIRFGSYEQDNDPSNGKEEIEWQVLKTEGNKVLLVSRYALDCRRFGDADTITWGTSELRSWLNGTFLSEAFGPKHREIILETNVTAEPNPTYDTDPGEDTVDRVFLLSISEIQELFVPIRKGTLAEVAKRCAPTAYAKANGCVPGTEDRIDGEYSCWWWLRNPGKESDSVMFVAYYGYPFELGTGCFSKKVGVRPAIWVTLGQE